MENMNQNTILAPFAEAVVNVFPKGSLVSSLPNEHPFFPLFYHKKDRVSKANFFCI